MKLGAFGTSILAAGFAAGLCMAQGDPAQLALEHSKSLKQNMGLLKQYSWKSRVEVEVKGEKKGTQLAQVRFNSEGEYERTTMGGESDVKKKRGIRGRIQKSKQKEAKEFTQDVVRLLVKYAMPSTGKMVDFFEKVTFTQSTAEGGSVQIQGKGMQKKGDTVTMWVDPESQLPKKLKVRTWVPKDEDDDERIWVDATTTYKILGNGASYPARTVVNVSAKETRLVMEQFDHIKQGG
jgi:hypothetical protein